MFDKELYNETFAQIHASEETLSEVLKMTKKKNNSIIRFTRMIVVAAIITVMLATTAFAYVGFTQYENPMQMLKTFFGSDEYYVEEGFSYTETYYDKVYNYIVPSEEHVPVDANLAENDVAPFISDVGQSITDHGDKLTVEAHLYDSATDCGIIYITLENPDGVRGYNIHWDGEVWWSGVERVVAHNCSGKNFIIEEETTDTKLSIAHYYSNVYGDENCIKVAFGDGDEFLCLPLNDGGGMDAISISGGDIHVSPIGIKINVDHMQFLCRTDTNGTVLPPNADRIKSLVIRYQDGSEYIVDMDTGVQYIKNYKYCINNMDGNERAYSFNRLIDVDQIEAVIINDVEFTDIQSLSETQRHEVPETRPELPPATEPVNP